MPPTDQPREPQTEAGREAKRIFGHDVEWVAHPDPMTGEDWDNMARRIVAADARHATPKPLDVKRLVRLAKDWRVSDEFIGKVVRSKVPREYGDAVEAEREEQGR